MNEGRKEERKGPESHCSLLYEVIKIHMDLPVVSAEGKWMMVFVPLRVLLFDVMIYM